MQPSRQRDHLLMMDRERGETVAARVIRINWRFLLIRSYRTTPRNNHGQQTMDTQMNFFFSFLAICKKILMSIDIFLNFLLQKIPWYPFEVNGWSRRSLWSYYLICLWQFDKEFVYYSTVLLHMKIMPIKSCYIMDYRLYVTTASLF
jgi:hypothetical protein